MVLPGSHWQLSVDICLVQKITMNQRNIIDLDQGWDFMQKGITKLKNILEGLPEPQFSSEDYMMLYTTIYNMCTQKPPHDYSQQLYDKYRESFEEYITSTVLPALREKHDEFMLRELVKRWSNHKIMVRWLSRFFHYLDRYFIARRSLPPLKEVGLTCFRDLVYQELNGKVRDAVISLIDQEREGEQIDRALLKNVLDIFVEIGMGQMDYYENDFEAAMLKDSAAYYSRKASNWILDDSCPDYMLKAEECLKREKDRVAHYLHSSSETKLLEKVQNELLYVYATQLLEKEHSGCHALLRDDKVGDLSRMYRLFSKIPRGLEPVANIFKQHVTTEGTAQVKQAEDAASNKKAEKKDIVGLQEQNYGAYFYMRGAGVTGLVLLKGFGNGSIIDLSLQQWTYQLGLKGEELGLSNGGSSHWKSDISLPTNQPLVWYKKTFAAPTGTSPVAIDFAGMGKGARHG